MADSEPEVSEEEVMNIWRKTAIEQQSFYCEKLKDRTWEKYTDDKNDIIHLQNKIGFVLFGPPKSDSSQDDLINNTCPEEGPIIKNTNMSDNNPDDLPPSTVEKNCSVTDNKNKTLFLKNDILMSLFSQELTTPDFINQYTKIDHELGECIHSPKGQEESKDFTDFMNFFFGLNTEDDITANSNHLYKDNISENASDSSDDESDTGNDDSEKFSELSSSENILKESCSDPEEKSTSQIGSKHTQNDESYIMFYSEPKQLRQINELMSSIKLCSNNVETNDVYIAFIFVIAKIGSSIAEFPVIRVLHQKHKEKEGNVYFIDSTGRCYKSWNNFLEDNCFPDCIYCYPKNGFYTCDEDDNVILEFGNSPETKFIRKFNKVGDIASSIAGLSSGVIVLAAIAAPIGAPVLAGAAATGVATGIWSTGRALYQLIDKKVHNQKLTDQEARGCWLNVATGVLSIASAGALRYTQYLAKNGRVIGKAASLVINGIEIGSTGMSGISIVHQVYNMFENKSVTASDTAELVISLLFFCNTALKYKTAERLLIESQHEVINGIEAQLSRRQKKAFKKAVKGTTAVTSVVEGNACIIKTVKNLEDPRSYFRDLSRAAKTANKTKSTLSFSEDGSGKLNINGKVKVEPEVLNSMNHKSKNKMFHSSKKFSQSSKYKKSFKRDMKTISKKENLAFKKNTFELQRKINSKTVHELKLDSKRIFSSVKTRDIKNINGFFEVITNDKNYEKIKPIIKLEVQESKCDHPYMLLKLILTTLMKLQSGEAKEMYNNLMNYYEKNLSDPLEKIIETIAEKICKVVRETNGNLKTTKHTFYKKVDMKSCLTPWHYFEMYFQKLWNSVPDRETVVELPQKVGCLYALSNNINLHSVFIIVIQMSCDVEKILLYAFLKASST